MTDSYTEHECHVVFAARLCEAIVDRDWPRARAIWRQLSPYHYLEPVQHLGAVLAYEEALLKMAQCQSTSIH